MFMIIRKELLSWRVEKGKCYKNLEEYWKKNAMRNIDKIKLRSIVIKNKWRSLRPPLFVYNNAHKFILQFSCTNEDLY